MKHTKITFTFKGGNIPVWTFNHNEAKILVQAEAIKNGWNYTIIDKINNVANKNLGLLIYDENIKEKSNCEYDDLSQECECY